MGVLEYDKDEDGYYVSLTLLSQGGDLRLMRDVIIPAELNQGEITRFSSPF